jgi:CHASE2 domain-containing sensor protein/predicted Ser/Thr protein kinase
MEEQRPRGHAPRPVAKGPGAPPNAASDAAPPSPDTLEHDSRLGAALGELADSFAGYTLVREVHRGGQGVVYEAIQHSTRRKVAVKVLNEGPLAGRRDRARFAREIEILAQLKHPNIVTIHDSGTAAGHAFFVMDYIAGQSLDQWSTAAPRSVDEMLRLFHRICLAVHAAHQRGIVHRDLKPGNIRIDTEGEPHILDFGLAKLPAGRISGDVAPQVMTLTGQFMGSIPWASPEQAEAIPGRIDPRTDVYALGVILYQLLTGRFPYVVVGNLRDVLSNILQAEPTRPSTVRRGIRPDVEVIVLRCLQKDRDRRYQTAGELARDIARYLAGEPIAARRDSVLYLLRIRTRSALRKHPTLAGVAIAAVAVLLTHYWPGALLVYTWTPANRLFERLATPSRASPPSVPFENIRVIALTAHTDLRLVATQAGIAPDDLTQHPRSMRRAHGLLMERLAGAGAATVVWDIRFDGESAYDEDFVRGVRALAQAGRSVIVAANTWPLGPDNFPALSATIAAATRWGCSPAGLQADEPWRVYLAVQRGLADPLPSLALRAFAAVRRPDCEFDVHLDRAGQRLTLVYWKSAARVPASRVPSGPTDEIRVTALREAEREQPKYGLKRGDMLAYYVLDLPSDDVLAAATVDYGQALAADRAELHRLVAGRVVLVSDQRDVTQTFPTPDHRSLAGTYAHATALDMLLRGAPVRVPSGEPALAVTSLAALLGLLAGRSLGARPRMRVTVLAVGCAAIMLIGFAEARYGRLLYNPLVAVLALVIASELAARVYAAIGSRRT